MRLFGSVRVGDRVRVGAVTSGGQGGRRSGHGGEAAGAGVWLVAVVLGVLVGLAAGCGAGWLIWGSG
jgi:hypothetical protein